MDVNNSAQIQTVLEANKRGVLVMTPQDYLEMMLRNARQEPRIAGELRQIYSGTPLQGLFEHTSLSLPALPPFCPRPPLSLQSLTPLRPSTSFAPTNHLNDPTTQPGLVLLHDMAAFGRTLKALGLDGWASRISYSEAGVYIILTGYADLRDEALRGTRYLAGNKKMFQFGLGLKTLEDVKGAWLVSMAVSTAIETLDFLTKDGATADDLIGGIAVEGAKNAIAAAAAYALTAAICGACASALLPGAVFLAVCFLAGTGLNAIDRRFEIKEKLVAGLKSINREALSAGLHKIELGIEDQARRTQEMYEKFPQLLSL